MKKKKIEDFDENEDENLQKDEKGDENKSKMMKNEKNYEKKKTKRRKMKTILKWVTRKSGPLLSQIINNSDGGQEA